MRAHVLRDRIALLTRSSETIGAYVYKLCFSNADELLNFISEQSQGSEQ